MIQVTIFLSYDGRKHTRRILTSVVYSDNYSRCHHHCNVLNLIGNTDLTDLPVEYMSLTNNPAHVCIGGEVETCSRHALSCFIYLKGAVESLSGHSQELGDS